MKILILASNPRKDLNLDREIRDLKDVIERSRSVPSGISRNLQQLEVVDELAVRVGDLQNFLFKHQPQIVHFCGHGSGTEGLVFEGNEGEEQWVRADALAGLFGFFPGVSCVLLNACYSEAQADAIVTHIDYVIGMRQTIRDDAAIAFSKGFYRALGYNFSIEQSYGVGCNAIQLEISGSSKRNSPTRSTVSEQERRAEVVNAIATTLLKEHEKPILKKKATLSGDAGFVSAEMRVAIQVEVDKALEEEDSSLREYREQVQDYLSDRQLSDAERFFLDQLRDDLGLSVEETEAIIQQELAPIQEAQQAYARRLTGLIAAGFDPLDATIQRELKKFQERRNLTDAEVAEISQPIFAAAEAEHRSSLEQQAAQEQQEQEEKQHRYRQELLRATQAAYPIADSIRLALKSFQQQIGLSDAAAAAIEQPIIERLEAEHQERLRQRDIDRLRREAEERQCREQAEAQRREEEAKRRPQLRSFEFQIATIDIESTGLFGNKKIIKTNQRRGQAEFFAEALSNTVTLEMVSILGDTFMMGSPNSELERSNSESPQHRVTIAPFYMGKFAVTQAQWKAIASLPKVNRDLNADPSNFKGSDRPVEKVSWEDAIEFCDRLSRKTGKKYRLPSEAEWEYACRAGTTTPFHFGETIATDLANYDGNSTYGEGVKGEYRKQTIAVGSFPPNAFGLYDMHGNVQEWCADYYHDSYQGAPTDGSAWVEGSRSRVLRGGSWYYFPRNCRSAYRNRYTPGYRSIGIGFRVVVAPRGLT